MLHECFHHFRKFFYVVGVILVCVVRFLLSVIICKGFEILRQRMLCLVVIVKGWCVFVVEVQCLVR